MIYGTAGLLGFLAQIVVGIQGRLLPLHGWYRVLVDRGDEAAAALCPLPGQPSPGAMDPAHLDVRCAAAGSRTGLHVVAAGPGLGALLLAGVILNAAQAIIFTSMPGMSAGSRQNLCW